MGICASVPYTRNQERLSITNGPPASSSTAKVIHSGDGRLQEFRQPTKASHVISDNFFLCNCETMFVNRHVPHVDADEELQPGQIYFLMPVSKSKKPVSLEELCSLAIKASLALDNKSTSETMRNGGTVSFSRRPKSNRNGKGNHEADFQLALKKLG